MFQPPDKTFLKPLDIKQQKRMGSSPGLVVMGGDSKFQRLSVRISAPFTGWTFFSFVCCKNCKVCLKRWKIKRPGMSHFFKKTAKKKFEWSSSIYIWIDQRPKIAFFIDKFSDCFCVKDFPNELSIIRLFIPHFLACEGRHHSSSKFLFYQLYLDVVTKYQNKSVCRLMVNVNL